MGLVDMSTTLVRYSCPFLGGSAAAPVTAGRIFFAFYPDLDNIGGSAHPRIDTQGLGGAVVYTGPAFHACIEINDACPMVRHFKNLVGADLGAEGAAHAFIPVQSQGGNRFIMS